MEINQIVEFKGTKSRGNSWNAFINDSHMKGYTKDSIYGKIFARQGNDIWVHIFDVKDNRQIDKSTWGFLKEDLLFIAVI